MRRGVRVSRMEIVDSDEDGDRTWLERGKFASFRESPREMRDHVSADTERQGGVFTDERRPCRSIRFVQMRGDRISVHDQIERTGVRASYLRDVPRVFDRFVLMSCIDEERRIQPTRQRPGPRNRTHRHRWTYRPRRGVVGRVGFFRWRGRWRGRWRDTAASAAGDKTVHTAGHLRVLCVREREGRGRRAPLWGSPAVRRATAHRGWRRPAAQEPGGGGVPHELGLGGFLGAVGEQQLHRGRQAGRQQEKQEQEGDGSGVVVCPGGGM